MPEKIAKVRLTPQQRLVLAHVRLHPDQRTDDMAHDMGWDVRRLRRILLALTHHGLVGRQESLIPHDFISTWRAETKDGGN